MSIRLWGVSGVSNADDRDRGELWTVADGGKVSSGGGGPDYLMDAEGRGLQRD